MKASDAMRLYRWLGARLHGLSLAMPFSYRREAELIDRSYRATGWDEA